MDIDVDGAAQLASSLDAAAADLQDLRVTGDRAGSLVAGVARRTAPRRTGALADSVQSVTKGALVSVTAGGGTVDYAAAVHARNPWMTRAAAKTSDQLVTLYTEHVDQAVDQIKGT